MTYISQSSDFVLILNVCTSYFGIMTLYDPKFDLKINAGHGPVIWPYLKYEHPCLGL